MLGYLGGKRSPPDGRDYTFDVHPHGAMLGTPLPPKVDHRPALPRAWDQSFLGSCEAHGCPAGALPFWMAVIPDFMPSRLAAYAWARQADGTPLTADTGCYTRSMLKVMQDGLYDEKVFPYDPAKFNELPPDAERVFKIAGYTSLTTVAQLMTHVAHGGCAPFAMELPDYFEGLGAGGAAVLKPYAGEKTIGEHCMCVVGYDTTMGPEPLAIVRNSWNDLWADGGHCYIPFSMILGPLGGDCWALYPGGNM